MNKTLVLGVLKKSPNNPTVPKVTTNNREWQEQQSRLHMSLTSPNLSLLLHSINKNFTSKIPLKEAKVITLLLLNTIVTVAPVE